MIINLDETPTWFNQHIPRTVDFIGNKSVYIRKELDTNNRKRITTVLAVTESGKMLDPTVIYQSQSRQTVQHPESTGHYRMGVKCYTQQNNTMTSSIMEDYINTVLSPQFPTAARKLLIMDSFSGHKTAEVKACLRKHNFDLLMIPGGYTSLLQPLDIAVNRSFKTKLRHLARQSQNTTLRASDRLDVLIHKVSRASKLISSECIQNGFHKMRANCM